MGCCRCVKASQRTRVRTCEQLVHQIENRGRQPVYAAGSERAISAYMPLRARYAPLTFLRFFFSFTQLVGTNKPFLLFTMSLQSSNVGDVSRQPLE